MLEGKGHHDEGGIGGGIQYSPEKEPLSDFVEETQIPNETNAELQNSGVEIISTPPLDEKDVDIG